MTDYYVDPAVGNDGNAGTAEGAGNAFATMGAAEAVIGAGDHVYCKASAVYTENLILTKSFTSAGNTVWYEGYTTTPGDGGSITVTPASGVGISSGASVRNYRCWENFRLTGCTFGYQDDAGDNAMFVNCEFDNNSVGGIQLDNGALFINCSIHDNSGQGADCDNAPTFVNCLFYGNQNSGALGIGGVYVNCVSRDPGGTSGGTASLCAQAGGNTSAACVIYQCTIDGEGEFGINADGVVLGTSQLAAILNNIFLSADQDGIAKAVSGALWNAQFIDHNLFWQNGTDVDAVFITQGDNNITGQDPLFVDEANDDYELTASSPAKDTGLTTRET